MNDPRPTILVTGISGSLGRRLVQLLSEFRVVGVDLSPLPEAPEITVHALDLGHESSCVALVRLLRESGAKAVLHLAAAGERHGVADQNRTWQVNVAGTARVMEAIAEVNRHGGNIRKFIYTSSAAVYGPETPQLIDEEAPLAPHSLDHAMQMAEADGVVRFRAGNMGVCSTYLLRPHSFAGATVRNYMLDAIRGRAAGNGKLAMRMQRKQKRLPLLLPSAEKLLQFVHVDDMARLMVWLLRRAPAEANEIQVLNVAGSGTPIRIAECAEIAGARIVRLPSSWLCVKVMEWLWRWKVSVVPPGAFPYISGSCTLNTRRLRELLGSDFGYVIRYSTEAALRESFAETEKSKDLPAPVIE